MIVRAVLCATLLFATVAACGAPPTSPPPVPSPVETSPAGSSTPASPAKSSSAVPTSGTATTTTPPPDDGDGPVVVLDPGHNGANGANPTAIGRLVPDGRGGSKACNTTGTETNDGYPEHAFNWDVADRVAARLVAAGVEVVLTRPDDEGVGPCVDERGQAGERADADAVVSIHADGSEPGNSGFHVALSDPPLNDAQDGPATVLAVALRDAMRGAGFPDSDYIGADGLSPRSDLAGLNHSTRPAALVECANMRNADEAALVSSPEGRDRYAAAIADGILAFLDL